MDRPLSGRFAREWAQCRLRMRLFWLALFAYPAPAAAAVALLAHRTQAPIAVPIIVAWPALILGTAMWWGAWPCPQCGKHFFYVFPSGTGTIFGVKACPWCNLPIWASEGGDPGVRAQPALSLAGAGTRQERCWYCGRGNGRAAPLVLQAAGMGGRRDLKVPRCLRCAVAHEVERGMGSVDLGFAGFFGSAAALFVFGIDPAAGFGAALLRILAVAGLAFVLGVAGFLAGIPLGRPGLWGTRPNADWEQHPEVQRQRAEGWEVSRPETGANIE